MAHRRNREREDLTEDELAAELAAEVTAGDPPEAPQAAELAAEVMAGDPPEAPQAAELAAEAPPAKFIRGILPGPRYVKTNVATGTREEISRAEWDLLR